jgi:hypothetical protein
MGALAILAAIATGQAHLVPAIVDVYLRKQLGRRQKRVNGLNYKQKGIKVGRVAS